MSKAAIVTGAGAGIGRAIALRLAKDGYDVAINARRENTLQEVAAEITAIGRRVVVIPGDVSDYSVCKAIVDRAVNELGGLDVLINNAGICPVRFISDVTPEEFEKSLRINLCSIYACTRYASDYMKTHGGGVIVNAASQTSFTQNMGNVEYCTSKWGIRGLTRTLAAELAAAHIRVVAYAPGKTWTNMQDQIAEGASKALGIPKEAYIANGKSKIPMGEFQTPDDVAALVSFLVSDEARYITGQNIMINGGEVMC